MAPRPPLEPRRLLLRMIAGAGLASLATYTVLYGVVGPWQAMVIEAAALGIAVAGFAWILGRPQHLTAQVLAMSGLVFASVSANILLFGGLVESGGVLVWVLVPVVAAIVFLEGWATSAVLGAAFVVVVTCVALEPLLESPHFMSGLERSQFFALNLVIVGLTVSVTMVYFLRRLQAEQRALRTSEQRFRATLHNAPYAIAIQDSRGRYTFANQGFAALFGLLPADVEGHADEEVFPPDLARVFREQALRARAGETTGETEELVEVDGARKVLRSTRFMLSTTASAQPDLCWIARDVTVRKRLQAEAARADRLQSVGTLAGGIAHDFNNILMAASGHLSLARADAGVGTRFDARLERVERALQRAAALTGQLLAFSRGGAPVRGAASVLDTIRDSAAFVMAGSRARAEFELPPDLPPAEADLSQVGRLVENLVLNAVQAMPEGGTVRISGDAVEEDGSTPGLRRGRRYVRIRVEDHGIGIPPEHLARIFEPYFTTRAGGRGLGLTTCHAIARSHEGTIVAESRLGEGSTFTVFIPAADTPVPVPSPVDTMPPHPGDLRVLAMDDEPALREVLEGMIGYLGYEAVTVADGNAAVQAWTHAREERRPFHVVLLDLTVRGGMGGVETLHRLQAMDPEVRAVAASGYSDDPVMGSYRDHGFRGVLPKPFRMDDLRRVLGEVLAQQA